MAKSNLLQWKIRPILLIMLCAVVLRAPAFFLSHNNFDEMAYVSLALKLDAYGFKGYQNTFDLKHIDVVGNEHIAFPILVAAPVGNFLHGSMADYEYRSPTHRPPGFSFFIMLSHRLFAGTLPYLVSVKNSLSLLLASWQYYAVIVPFLFSVLFIVATYYLGTILFKEEVGCFAALFLSFTPTELFVSQKIWSETMLAFFTVLAAIFYFLALHKKKIFYSLLCGISIAMSLYAKLTGVFILIALAIFQPWKAFVDTKDLKKTAASLFEPSFVVILVAFVCAVIGWYVTTFGREYIVPISSSTSFETPWLNFVGHRSKLVYLVNIPAQFPMYCLLYFALVDIFFDRQKRQEKVFLAIWFLVTLVTLTLIIWCKEERYMMVAYAPIAILSSVGLCTIKNLLEERFKPLYVRMAIVIIVALSCWYALGLSIGLVLSRNNLLPFPL